ncbi:hypothetical protein NB705_003264 [Xanthomonas sacchari]|nr:hypothetical protein [Xanthomonas sacchari]
MRAGAVDIAVDQQCGAAVVVVVGEGAAVGDGLRPAPVHQHAAVQVDAAAAAVHAHAGVDVADVVQRIAVLVPAQHATHLLDLCLQPDVARHRHEQQGEGQAVDVARGVALGDAVGGLGVVLQVQAVGIEGQRHQLLQAVFGIGAAVDALLQQRMQRRWQLHDLLRDRNGGCRGSRRRNRRCRLSLDGRCRVRGRQRRCGRRRGGRGGGEQGERGPGEHDAPRGALQWRGLACTIGPRWRDRTVIVAVPTSGLRPTRSTAAVIHSRCGRTRGNRVDKSLPPRRHNARRQDGENFATCLTAQCGHERVFTTGNTA